MRNIHCQFIRFNINDQICFFTGKITQFSVLTLHGGVGMTQWAATLPLVAFAICGVFAGARIRHRINAETYRVWVKRALWVIAFALLAQYIYLHWLR